MFVVIFLFITLLHAQLSSPIRVFVGNWLRVRLQVWISIYKDIKFLGKFHCQRAVVSVCFVWRLSEGLSTSEVSIGFSRFSTYYVRTRNQSLLWRAALVQKPINEDHEWFSWNSHIHARILYIRASGRVKGEKWVEISVDIFCTTGILSYRK